MFIALDGGGRQAGTEAGKERGRVEDGREGAWGWWWREGGSDDAREGGRGSGGKERVRKERRYGRNEGKRGGRKRAEDGGR